VLVSGPGAEARNSIGTVLVTGMTLGTLFTLFVVPVFYSLIAARHRQTPVELEDEALEAAPAEPLHGLLPARARILVLAILAGSLAVACRVGPDYHRPPLTTPDRLRGAEAQAASGGPAASLADQAWWDILRDDALQSLIEEALRNGYDLRLAAWRVEEARAFAGIARSEFYPALQATGGITHGRASEFVESGGGETGELYDINLGMSWEIDLWGRIRRLNEAALANYLATEEGRRGVLLSLVADVAASYFELRALDFQLEIARRTAEAFEGTHALFSRRLEAGLASSLETSSAAASLATTQAIIPDLEREITAVENRISFLLGRVPGEVARGAALDEQLLPPEIPSGLPSDLLERRPDLRQAEQELVAANAEVGVAVADYFPRISLTAAFGGLAPELSELFGDGKRWSVGAGFLTPVFQGRRLQNQHRAAVARWEQARVLYEQSVSNAFAEVSTALVAYRKLADVERELALAVAGHREAVELSNSRYLSGLSDYFEVLQAQRQLFPAENALAQTRFARLATLVQLYRALGGGWNLADAEWAG
jgi:multidrug efflux system outer membrane protein